ncbi:hypothetical protein A0O34_05170 [Chryseobacterium glaciei]|uniref:Uncharacterized protein n=1 Tax=Chryseobacterium glaciei TaxID=1685010 RepID=A0A172XSH1_9FLAO|nr:hypothetical protein [Chryseobacterium glaciei]ANF49953.1 hypothetical protein A0O34_05170 [Chryseobacterium glaciei]
MKGGGGGSHSYTREIQNSTKGISSASGEINCKDIQFDTDLKNIQPITKTLKVGDILSIEKNDLGLVVALYNGKLCGMLDSLAVSSLIKCIDAGFIYKGSVVELQSTNCKVKVRHYTP